MKRFMSAFLRGMSDVPLSIRQSGQDEWMDGKKGAGKAAEKEGIMVHRLRKLIAAKSRKSRKDER